MIDYSFSVNDLEYFLLILTRVASFVYLSPFFGMNGVPSRVKIAISFFTAALLYQTMPYVNIGEYNTILGYSIIVLKEATVGLLIGFAANICMSIVNFAGHIADMETGLSMVTLMDPATRENSSITGVLYQYAIMMMLVASGMYRYLFSALADTFQLIPVNGAVFHTDSLLQSMVTFLGDYVFIGFRIVLPVFCVILLLNAILGVLAKVSPQMNMFAVGMQLKVIVGLSVLFLSAGMLPSVSDFIFREIQEMISSFVGGMM